LDYFELKILSAFGFLVDSLEIHVGDSQVRVVIEVDRYSLLVTDLHCRTFKFISVPLFEKAVSLLAQELKIFLLAELYP
jgi:hypothetical protein